MSEDEKPAIVAGADVLHFPDKKKHKTRVKLGEIEGSGGGITRIDEGDTLIEDMNDEWSLVLLGSKSIVVRRAPGAPSDDLLRFLSVEAFKTYHLNRFVERRQKDGTIRSVTHANAWLGSRQRQTYNGVEFFPNPDGAPGFKGYMNLWQGFGLNPAKVPGASYAIFQDHLLTNVAGGNRDLADWIFGWFAHIVQKPRERIGTAIVLRGKRGAGKTKIGEVMGSLFPAHYFLIDDPRYLVGQFNAHLASCLLLQADEGFWAGDKGAEGRLKGLITAERQMIEAKGIDPIRVRNYVRLMITSNEDWVVPAGKDERRFFVCDVSDHVAEQHGYFREMEAELDAGGRAALLADLLAFDLDRVNLRVAPRTDALLKQKLQTLDPFDAWWFERLDSGVTKKGHTSWESEVQKDDLYDDYIACADRTGIKRKLEKPLWGHRMYKAMPTLKEVKRRSSDFHGGGPSGRIRNYELPSLAEARSDFELSVGQRVSWPPDNAVESSEREQVAIF